MFCWFEAFLEFTFIKDLPHSMIQLGSLRYKMTRQYPRDSKFYFKGIVRTRYIFWKYLMIFWVYLPNICSLVTNLLWYNNKWAKYWVKVCKTLGPKRTNIRMILVEKFYPCEPSSLQRAAASNSLLHQVPIYETLAI